MTTTSDPGAQATAKMETARDFLRQVAGMHERSARGEQARRGGWPWSSYEQIALELGTPMVVTASEAAVLPDGVEPGEARDCSYNAHTLAFTDHNRFRYVEGFAMVAFMPVAHAWCLDLHTGRIVDPTWTHIEHDGPVPYLGVGFSHQFIAALSLATGNPGVFDDDWRQHHQVLKRGFDLDAAGVVTGWGDGDSR